MSRSMSIEQRTATPLEVARSIPGTAEFLSALLTASKNTKCSHFPKIKPGSASKVPHRLGFFAQSVGTISCLKTERLCLNCYKLAVPSGYVFWSTGEVGPQHGKLLPTCFEAGPAGFGTKADNDGVLLPPAAMVAGADAEDAFEWLQARKVPFFIDHLHLTRPFNSAAANLQTERLHVQQEVRVASENARTCIVTTAPGRPLEANDFMQRKEAVGPRLVDVARREPQTGTQKAKVCLSSSRIL